MTLEEKLILFKEKGYTYNPETGIVTSHKGKIIKGKSGGYFNMGIKIGLKTIHVQVHQYAWYIMYNEIPTEVDHMDTNKLNNKISNLRNITHHQNLFNTNAKGYSWDKAHNKYSSHIRLNYKKIWLGFFDTPEEAHQAYLDAKKIYHII